MSKTKVIKLMGAWIDGEYVAYEDMIVKYANACMKRVYDEQIIMDGHTIIPDRKEYIEEFDYMDKSWRFN